MRCVTAFVLLAALVAGSEGAARLEPADIHPGHEGECYVPIIKGYLKPGGKRYLSNCSIIKCDNNDGQLYLYFESCGVVAHDNSCTPIPVSRFAVYPKCCILYKCPPGATFSAVG